MSYSFPDSVSPYLEQGFLYSLGILAGDAANNVVEIDREKMITTGQFLNIERIDEVDAPVRRDIATTGQTRSILYRNG